MNTKKRMPKRASKLPEGWVVSEELKLPRRALIVPGTELNVDGIRGRVRFVRHVKTPEKEWIDVVHGSKAGWRSVPVTAIGTVYRNRKMWGND